jgi:predicted ATPase
MRAETLSFGPYLPMGHAFRAEIAIRRGDVEVGAAALQKQLENLHVARFELFTVRFHFVLIAGFAATGRYSDAWSLAEETAQLIEDKGYFSYLPELLRLKGSILFASPELSNMDAETFLTQSLEMSRDQGAGSWELRAATDLARLWADQDRSTDARELLHPIFERMTEGRDTPDLKAAADALERLAHHGG